jgi:hypothetical protein
MGRGPLVIDSQGLSIQDQAGSLATHLALVFFFPITTNISQESFFLSLHCYLWTFT